MNTLVISKELEFLKTQLEYTSCPVNLVTLETICQQIELTAHLAVLNQPYLDKLIKREKIIESRFSKVRVSPFQKVRPKDVIILKQAGGSILALARVSKVNFLGPLLPGQARSYMEKFSRELALEEQFKHLKEDSIYGTFIYFEEIVSIKPITLLKSDRRAWVTLNYEPQPKLL